MTFMTSQPDLANTVFSNEDLLKARETLFQWLEKEKPSWLKKPKGLYGEYWLRDDANSACQLINLAHMIYTARLHMEAQSIGKLNKKLREVIFPNHNKITSQFYDTLAELQFLYLLVNIASPIELEPEIPGQTRAPDTVLRHSDGDIYLEVTTFRGGKLDEWEEDAKYIRKAIELKVQKLKIKIRIHIELPFFHSDKDQIAKQIFDYIYHARTNQGEAVLDGNIKLKWSPMPIIKWPTTSSENNASIAGEGVIASEGITVMNAVATQIDMSVSSREEAIESLETSIINKLKGKHDQSPKSQITIIVLKLDHHLLHINDVIGFLRSSVWGKKDFSWISGIIFLVPKKGFNADDDEAQLILEINDQARFPITDAFLKAFNPDPHR